MEITKPTLLINKKKCITNILSMLQKANQNNVVLRPHFKTHQNILVGKWYRELGIKKITVSSVTMAKFFFADKWNDITIAFPVNVREIKDINNLAKKITINLLIESYETLLILEKKIIHPVGIFIKIDTGYHRTGIASDNLILTDKLINHLKKNRILLFKGFITHSGNTYAVKNTQLIKKIFTNSSKQLIKLKSRYLSLFPELIISTGDTPSCSIVKNFSGIDEIRPGNFVFYDIMQQYLGVCSFSQIAVGVACPIVAIHYQRNEVVIYGGAVHFSKDYIIDKNGNKNFGLVCIYNTNYGWSNPIPNSYVKAISQEHGIVTIPNILKYNIRIGSILTIIPAHSCLTVDAMKGNPINIIE